jgi:hypothetical protein
MYNIYGIYWSKKSTYFDHSVLSFCVSVLSVGWTLQSGQWLLPQQSGGYRGSDLGEALGQRIDLWYNLTMFAQLNVL